MGKYERDWAEQAEQDVATGLDNQPVEPHIDRICHSVRGYVQDRYGKCVRSARWTGGNDYKDPGDVIVTLDDDAEIHLEMKFSHKGGSGTTKNPGAGYFRDRINASIQSYVDHEQDLRRQRYALLEQRLQRPVSDVREYEETLYRIRDNGEAGDAIDAAFIKQIADITGPGQEAYATYAAGELKKYLPEVNQAALEIMNITNSGQGLKQDTVYCVVKHFESDQQIVEFPDYTEMDLEITDVVSVGNSIKWQNKSGHDVLRFSVTWKNLCQGGKTPCFNVWVGNAYQKVQKNAKKL